ncbi:UNVERIFIED_CONTAM: hypothetical protein GTU68_046292 [Idotea baltica]|nr:hypothetical protein [Idotea baltica]
MARSCQEATLSFSSKT